MTYTQTIKYTKADLITELETFHGIHKKVPRRTDLKIPKHHYTRHFGTFTNALVECGYREQPKKKQILLLECKNCNTEFTAVVRPNDTRYFCNKNCSIKYLIKNKDWVAHSLKIKSLPPRPITLKCNIYYNICVICSKKFIFGSIKKSCGKECYTKIRSATGKVSAGKRIKRSKNEIALYELLKSKHDNILNNIPMFNGWDADIILPDLKIAVLWNGPWHYRKITEKHSVLQVQNRDNLKLKEILNMGYKAIIVKDCDNKMSPDKANEIIISLINQDFNCLTVI